MDSKGNQTIPLSREEFDRIREASLGFGSMLFIMRQASWPPGSIAVDVEGLLKPYHSDLSVLSEDLEWRFNQAEKKEAPDA